MPGTIKRLREHWQAEGEAAALYEALAQMEPDAGRRKILQRMVEAERRHQEAFAERLAQGKVPAGPFRPGWRTRALAWLARHGGFGTVLNLTIREETRAVKGYRQDERGAEDASAIPERIAAEEARHAQMLQGLASQRAEPWHRSDSGSFLRNVVYGFNDGLTANFGLIMGVLGAEAQASFVLLSGLAGLIADALSMGSSSYLAGKSEQEVYEHEIAMEREEMQLTPEAEQEELALIYEAKGLPPQAAREVAAQLSANPEIALREMAREELGIAGEAGSPLKDGVLTGLATAFGALIPVFPFFWGSGRWAVGTAFAISMLSHFAVGGARSLFTGRGVFRSGLDMFLVGLGVAVVGYWGGGFLTGRL